MFTSFFFGRRLYLSDYLAVFFCQISVYAVLSIKCVQVCSGWADREKMSVFEYFLFEKCVLKFLNFF